MSLVIEKPAVSFDMSQIKTGYLLWGKHCTWNEGKAGFVTSVTGDKLIVQYHPRIGNVTNHFMIPVSEVVDGQWEIRWSADMAEVQEYNVKTAIDKEHLTEGGEEGGTGGTDL